MLPGTSDENVSQLLLLRRFVIIEGPPGTGKTELKTCSCAARVKRSFCASRRTTALRPGKHGLGTSKPRRFGCMPRFCGTYQSSMPPGSAGHASRARRRDWITERE